MKVTQQEISSQNSMCLKLQTGRILDLLYRKDRQYSCHVVSTTHRVAEFEIL
jgi:hypothetical protein